MTAPDTVPKPVKFALLPIVMPVLSVSVPPLNWILPFVMLSAPPLIVRLPVLADLQRLVDAADRDRSRRRRGAGELQGGGAIQ